MKDNFIYRNVSNPIVVLISIFCSISGYTVKTIYDSLEEPAKTLEFADWSNIVNNNMWEITACAILIILIILDILFSIHRKKCGIRGVKISRGKFLRRYSIGIYKKVMKCIHDFEHVYVESVNNLKKNNVSNKINDLSVITEIGKLLQIIQKVLKSLVEVDFSIHVKLFYKQSTGKGYSYLAKEHGYRVASLSEIDRYNEIPSLRVRNGDEVFLVDIHSTNDMKKIVAEAKEFIDKHKNDDDQKKNSAYDYVLGKTNHYWLSNNLVEDEKNGFFISSSKEYLNYYRSLGVFVIAPPTRNADNVNDDNAYGLLIVDSMECNIFHKKITPILLGYFAHRLYDFIVSTNIQR